MGTLHFEIEVPLPRRQTLELMLQHFRDLGYRVEEADRINNKLVMDRGWVLGALFGGPVHRRRVWLRASFALLRNTAGDEKTVVTASFSGWGKATNPEAQTYIERELQGFHEACETQIVKHEQSEKRRTGAAGGQALAREVIIREVVRIPCKYCGHLVENTDKKCENCGAPIG